MKLNVLACCLSLLGTAAFAQKNEWRDPNVNEINRAPMHTNYFAYEDENSALKGCKESSGYNPQNHPSTFSKRSVSILRFFSKTKRLF